MYTAIVTGATRGIGYAIAGAIADAGGRVLITGREAPAVEAAATRIGAQCGDPARVIGRAVDVRDRAGVDAMVAAALDRFGRLDTLVNNAGVGVFTEVEQTSDEDWGRVIDTNLTGVFYCSRAAIPAIRQAGGGWIINIASLAGRNYFAGASAYCASKAGLVAFSEALMLEVRQAGIRVSVIMPGSVATEFSGPSVKTDDESWKLTPGDIAQTVMDLLRHPGRSLPSKVEIRPARTRGQ